jgi:hypothetical protein
LRQTGRGLGFGVSLAVMSNLFTASALERLRVELLPFGDEWRSGAGRGLASAQHALDFLAGMKDRDALWSTLAAASSEPSFAGELQALRDALPGELGSNQTVEDRLRRLGMSSEDVSRLLAALAEPEGPSEAIRDAFMAGRPQDTAQALEQILDLSPEVITTDRHVRRFEHARGIRRVLSALMGIALFLVGASYAAEAKASDSKDQAAAGQTSEKTPQQAAGKPKAAKPKPQQPRPVPRYKGISPLPRARDGSARTPRT